jgi:photosystem II stability/assembly factor-like uncharacterized protein
VSILTHGQPQPNPLASVDAKSSPANPDVIETSAPNSISILVDDFSPQPYQGETKYFYNRLEGDRGILNNSNLDWGDGQVRMTISLGNSWGGMWMSLNHPIREGLPINFSAILPLQINPIYQSKITGITVQIAGGTAGRTFRIELKNGNDLRWKKEFTLDGGQQMISSGLPALGDINQLILVLDHAIPGDYVVADRVSFTATTKITDTAMAAFVWSYGMLLNNWNPDTGLVRDKAKDASGEFDAIQATGSLAAATAIAEQLGVVEHSEAIQIVNKISDTLLNKIPRSHGLWPHWVKTTPEGEFTIVANTEWSSVDTVIAAIGLLDAQTGLELDTSGTEQMLQSIEWNNLVTTQGISHGYTYTGNLLPYTWDTFGGESWLVELAYAGAIGQVVPVTYTTPPTANGSGFIDELAWLLVPPPSGQDYWGTDWTSYRLTAANNQILYYAINQTSSCFSQPGLFGLSAGEVPSPSRVSPDSIYQAFGVGGRFTGSDDGSALFGTPVVVPHYSAMVASLYPDQAIKMWDWLINNSFFSPLNNVESLMFPLHTACDPDSAVWNQLKGSWNLSLQTLGWGRYLAEREGQIPILWEATKSNTFLSKGYLLLVQNKILSNPTLTTRAGITSAENIVWISIGLEGESINALVIDPVTPNTVYAGGPSGVFKTTDSGKNWGKTSLTNTAVNAMVIDPVAQTTLYVGTDGGVLKSTNGGESWINAGLYRVRALAIDPVTPTTLFVGTEGGVFKSTNSGEDWRDISRGMDRPPNGGQTGFAVVALVINPIDPTALYAATSSYTYPGSWRYYPGGVFKSMNGGESWSKINWSYNKFNTLAIDPMTSTTIYAAIDGIGVIKSTDGGGSWGAFKTGLATPFIYALAIDPVMPVVVYAGTDQGIFISTNGDNNWYNFGSGLTSTNAVRTLAIDSAMSSTLYAGTDDGVYKSMNGNPPVPWTYEKECEYADEGTVGQSIQRSNASGLMVYGQFGTTGYSPWSAQPGYVEYKNIDIPAIDNLYLKFRYSKYSSPTVPILIYIDDEPTPRATFYPIDQGSWNGFIWSEPISLGSIGSGVHSIKLYTDGQQYGIADLDEFILLTNPP